MDGIDHINIYSKGKTELGRALSNFALTPFKYEPYGRFQSVEGFWYWYLTGQKHDQFRNLYGWQAKEEGKKYRNDRVDKEGIRPEGREILLEAIRCKLRQNKHILKLLAASELPFRHYYDYNGKIVELPQYQWIVDEFERLRSILKDKWKY